MAGFSPLMASVDRAIKEFLWTHMYRHQRVIEVMAAAEGVVQDLFGRFLERPEDMPGEWAQCLGDADTFARARRIADFIAGMTDRFALTEHARLVEASVSRP